MPHPNPEHSSYWQAVTDEVAALSDSPVSIEELPIRSNEVSTAYTMSFEGVGGYPLFAYHIVPKGDGPWPAVFQAPAYGSVASVPHYNRRKRYVVMGASYRGQRLSDSRYSAQYPGLLTDRLPDAAGYRWRDIAADCLRALDVFAAQPQVDGARLAVSGNDVAAITTAFRPRVDVLLLSGMMFRDTPSRLASVDTYPLQEFNDYLRVNPQYEEAVAGTLALFDPLAFAPRIDAETLVTCGKGERDAAQEVVDALPGKASLRVNTGYGYLDHEFEEEWLAEALTA